MAMRRRIMSVNGTGICRSKCVRHLGFLLVPQFSMLSVASAIDPLRAANRALGKPAYRWTLTSVDGGPVRASNGMEIVVNCALAALMDCDLLFVCAGLNTSPLGLGQIHAELRARSRHGVALGAISTGSQILAGAGLLDGYRCTVHWENQASFVEAFPRTICTAHLFEIDRNRYTCAGGTASIDLMLQIIRADHGPAIAAEAANQFQHDHARTSDDRQKAGVERNLSAMPAKLRTAVELMAANLEEPLSATAIAVRAGLSVRQLERLFLKHLRCTPGHYYTMVRLERARQLLRQTNATILDVALATGFTTHSYFAHTYRNQFGRSPSEERRSLS
jgi:transcriptional regulator GlxA family with amidase domain